MGRVVGRGSWVAASVACAALAAAWTRPPGGSGAEMEVRAGVLLVAREGMPDPNFRESVILIARHDRGGTLGLVVNRPGTAELGRVFPEVEGLKRSTERLYIGGPVSPWMLLLLLRADRPPAQSLQVMENLYLSGDPDLLRELPDRPEPARGLRVFAGHAGWAPGQLDAEIARGDWHVVPAERETVFSDRPGDLWKELIDDFRGQWVEVPGSDPRIARSIGGSCG